MKNSLYWPENVIFWGAGATCELGMPLTIKQEELVKLVFSDDFSKAEFGQEAKDLFIYKTYYQKFQKAIETVEKDIELRKTYNLEILRKIIKICPQQSNGMIKLTDLYGILDLYIQSGKGFTIHGEFVPFNEMIAAKNMMVLIIQLYFYLQYEVLVKHHSSTLKLYYDFYKLLAIKMLEEGRKKFDRDLIDNRRYFMFDYSIISMNWDPVFMWQILNVHKDLNAETNFMVDTPPVKLKLYNDFATFLGTRSLDIKRRIWFPCNETVVQRANNPEKDTPDRYRMGKVYFPHGNFNWRECPNCGKLMMYKGEQWGYDSRSLFPPLPFTTFSEHFKVKTENEKVWRSEGKYDAISCVYCQAETRAHHTCLLLQSMMKGLNPPYIEEIQRDMKLSLENAKHILFMGYSLPSDDIIYRSILASRCNTGDVELMVSIVLFDGHEGIEDKWYEGDELNNYLKESSNQDVIATITRIQEVLHKASIRVYLKGIPAVFSDNGGVSKNKVYELMRWS